MTDEVASPILWGSIILTGVEKHGGVSKGFAGTSFGSASIVHSSFVSDMPLLLTAFTSGKKPKQTRSSNLHLALLTCSFFFTPSSKWCVLSLPARSPSHICVYTRGIDLDTRTAQSGICIVYISKPRMNCIITFISSTFNHKWNCTIIEG